MEEFLKPIGIQYRLVEKIHLSVRMINEIVLEKQGITADTALQLSRYCGNPAQFRMNLQTRYELESVRDASEDRIYNEIRPHGA